MKATVSGWHTDIYPTDEEVKKHCRPGAGADTCSWLIVGPEGWRCYFLNKKAACAILDKPSKGIMVTTRDGCERVSGIVPSNLGLGTFEV